MAITKGHGNPDWTRDEVILALDLYQHCDGKIPSKNDARVKALSELLRKLPYHAQAARKERFRNADGVAFKLQNIRQIASGKGLGHVGGVDREVWSEFGKDPHRVQELVILIKQGIDLTNKLPASDPNQYEFSEGRVITELHNRRERHPGVRKNFLKHRKASGRLVCEMCDCKSLSIDSAFEDATFEAHHRKLISNGDVRKTRLSEMALLCASCHRILHRAIAAAKQWIDIEDARSLVRRGQ